MDLANAVVNDFAPSWIENVLNRNSVKTASELLATVGLGINADDTNGRCGYGCGTAGDCSTCSGWSAQEFCTSSQSNCEGPCNGRWCSGSGPAPPSPPSPPTPAPSPTPVPVPGPV